MTHDTKKEDTNQTEETDQRSTEENGLTVKVYTNDKDSIKQPDCCKDNILPKLHCSYLAIGKSGSGKSSVIIHMLKSPALLKGVFHQTYLFLGSPDESFADHVEMKKENIIKNFDLSKLESILEDQKAIIKKKGKKEASKTHNTVIVFDDILSQKKFLASSMLTKLVTEARHYLITCMFGSQSYKNIPRVVRINCRGLLFFPSSRGEVIKFAEEQCNPNMSQTKFVELVEYCTDKAYAFCFINHDAQAKERIRKNFDTVVSYE